MTKIIKKRDKINPFGGINYIKNYLDHSKIASLINRQLGNRVTQSKYSYADTILGWAYCNIAGCKRLEDSVHIKEHLQTIPGIKIPSPDRIGGIMKKLSPKTTIESATTDKTYNEYHFVNDDTLNDLNIKICKKLNLFDKGVLDYDNTAIYCKKIDSKPTYKKDIGYMPGVSFVDGTPVYVQNRDGNASPSFKIKDTIEKSIDLCKKNGVKINIVRSDAAGYNMELFKYCENKDNDIEFLVRAPKIIKEFKDEFRWSNDWKEYNFNGFRHKLKVVRYTPTFFKKHPNQVIEPGEGKFRIILQKTYQEDGFHTERMIITNNESMNEKEIVEFYNARGAIERHFDDLKNNFNWNRIPFSKLEYNNTFLIVSAIAYNMYQYIIKELSKKVDRLEPTSRLKHFYQYFIRVSSEWINNQLVLYTDKEYPPLG